jgi:hypothetical protein
MKSVSKKTVSAIKKVLKKRPVAVRVKVADALMRKGMPKIKAIHKAGLWYRQYLKFKKIESLKSKKVPSPRRAA